MGEIKPENSAITLPYYTLQSELIELFQKVTIDPSCAKHMERYGTEIKMALGNALFWFYFVQNIAYCELPLPIQLTQRESIQPTIGKGIKKLLSPRHAVQKALHPPKAIPTLTAFVNALEKINALGRQGLPEIRTVSSPKGESVDIMDHLKAQRDRLKVSIQVLESDLERLPSFRIVARWKKTWKVENGKIVAALKKALNRLEGLIKQDRCETEQLFIFALTVSGETWHVVINSSHALNDLLATVANEIKDDNLKAIPKRLAIIHNQITSSTIYDLSHTITYLISLSVTNGRSTHEVQQICHPLRMELKRLHYKNWENEPETDSFICAIDKGFLQLESSLTPLDADRVTPLELSAPARLIFLLDEAITDETEAAALLKETLRKTVEAFLEKSVEGTVLRPTPNWRLCGELISQKLNKLTKSLSSAITPPRHVLQAELMTAYAELRKHKAFMKVNFKAIRQAFPILLRCEDALKLLETVAEQWKGPLPLPFIQLRACAKKIGEVSLDKPPGCSTDVRQHMSALAKRVQITLEIIEHHIEELPCFVSRFLWANDLKEFNDFWAEKKGILVAALQTTCLSMTNIETFANSTKIAALLHIPAIRRTAKAISEHLGEYSDQEHPRDLMLTLAHILNTIADDVELHITKLSEATSEAKIEK